MNFLQLKAFAEQHDPWSCRAYGNVAQNLNNGSFTFSEMTVIDFDPAGMVTTGVGGVVTIPVDGIYSVNVCGSIAAAADGTRLAVGIFKNGTEVKRGFDWLSGAAQPLAGSAHAILYLKAGDQLKMGQFTQTAGMLTVAASPYLFIDVAYLCAA